MTKRIKRKLKKQRWFKELGATRCTRCFVAETVDGKLRISAVSRLRYDRESETRPGVMVIDKIPVRVFPLS